MSSAYRTVNRVRAVNDLRSDRVLLMHFITGVCFQQVYRSLSSDVFWVGLNNQLELCNIQISRATCFYNCKMCHNILKFSVQTRREHSGLLQTSVKKKDLNIFFWMGNDAAKVTFPATIYHYNHYNKKRFALFLYCLTLSQLLMSWK